MRLARRLQHQGEPKCAVLRAAVQKGTEPEPTAGNGVVRTENTVANGISSPSTFVSHNDVIGSSFRSNQITSGLGSVTVNIGS